MRPAISMPFARASFGGLGQFINKVLGDVYSGDMGSHVGHAGRREQDNPARIFTGNWRAYCINPVNFPDHRQPGFENSAPASTFFKFEKLAPTDGFRVTVAPGKILRYLKFISPKSVPPSNRRIKCKSCTESRSKILWLPGDPLRERHRLSGKEHFYTFAVSQGRSPCKQYGCDPAGHLQNRLPIF